MHEELLDFFLTKDVWGGALTSPTEYACWWHLVPRVLGVHEAGKASHRLQPIMPLGFRRARVAHAIAVLVTTWVSPRPPAKRANWRR